MLKIGIILGSTREGRVSPQVGTWVKEVAEKRRDAEYEIIDIADFKLPLLGSRAEMLQSSGLVRKSRSMRRLCLYCC